MGEIRAITRIGNNLTSRSIHIASNNSLADRLDTGQVGRQYRIVHLHHLRRRLPDEADPCHIRLVPIDLHTKINENRLALVHRAHRRTTMWQRAALSGSDDRIEAHRLCARRDGVVMHECGDLIFGHAYMQLLEHLGIYIIRNIDGMLNRGDLILVLDNTHARELAIKQHGLDVKIA